MATRRTKNGDDEKLDATNLEKVIALLEPTEMAVTTQRQLPKDLFVHSTVNG